jgi:hypothetical protein
LREPASAARLAPVLEQDRQVVDYHLRELERRAGAPELTANGRLLAGAGRAPRARIDESERLLRRERLVREAPADLDEAATDRHTERMARSAEIHAEAVGVVLGHGLTGLDVIQHGRHLQSLVLKFLDVKKLSRC